MSNRGVFSNEAQDAWHYYNPTPRLAGSGTVTQTPFWDTVDGHSYQFGRYVVEDDGLVIAEIQAQLIGNSVVGNVSNGSGNAQYVFRLPVRARRMTGPNTNCPIPIGSAMCYFSFVAPLTNMACIPTLADPELPLGNDEDNWCQLYAPYALGWGTDTITSGGSSKATTWNANGQLGPAIQAQDVELMNVDGNVGVGTPFLYVDTIGNSSFTAHTRAGTTANFVYNYKVRAEQIATSAATSAPLVGPAYPWDWTKFSSIGPFGNFFIQVAYEAA